MDLDEAEQYWLGRKDWVWGYPRQAPLYTWIVKVVSNLFGLTLPTLAFIKYAILLAFYLSFYFLCRLFWRSRDALLVTGFLFLIPLYSYVFNFDLTHTVLITAIASLTCLVFFKVIRKRSVVNYALLGIVIGLGILAKYNFVFFASALFLASLFSRLRRRILSLKLIITFLVPMIMFYPHLDWLLTNNFSTFQYALETSQATYSGFNLIKTSLLIFNRYVSQILPAILLFWILFGRRLTLNAIRKKASIRLIQSLAIYSFVVPIITVFLLQAHKFQSRWGTTAYFLVVLALFLSAYQTRPRAQGILLIPYEKFLFGIFLVIISISFTIKPSLYFYPDFYKKARRINIPFDAIATELVARLNKQNLDLPNTLFLVQHKHTAANLSYQLPEANIVVESEYSIVQGDGISDNKSPDQKNLVLIWDAIRSGKNIPHELELLVPNAIMQESIKIKYLNSKQLSPFILGWAIG